MTELPDDALTRDEMVAYAEAQGWKAWGRLRKYPQGSSYQAFRRKNEYVWIGFAFVERTGRGIAQDFRYAAKEAKELVA